MKKILVTFKVVQGEQEFYEYVSLKDNEWTDEDLLEEVYAPNGLYNKEYNYWEDDYGQRIFKVHFISSITDEELKVLKKFNMVYDIWEDLHSPEKYNYKEAKMKKSKPKLKVVKLDDKRPLGDEEQITLVRDKMLDLFDEIHNKVTIPNTIIGVQLLVTDLAFDTAPSNTVAASMLLDIINHRLRIEVEEEAKGE